MCALYGESKMAPVRFRTHASNYLVKFHPAHEFDKCFAGTLCEDTSLAPKMLVTDEEYEARRTDYACPENVQHSPAEWKRLFQSPKGNPTSNPDETENQPGEEPGPSAPKKLKLGKERYRFSHVCNSTS